MSDTGLVLFLLLPRTKNENSQSVRMGERWEGMSRWFDNREGVQFDDVVWGLDGCCGVEENLFLTFYVVYAAVFFLLHRLYVLKPVRLLTVFLHEFGHASGEYGGCQNRRSWCGYLHLEIACSHRFIHHVYGACWVTGGSVRKIEVYENEGGVTGYTGGCRLLVR